MQNEPDPNTCSDDTQQIVINIPCRLFERVQKYAKEHGDTITGVFIEALDAVLGGRMVGWFGVFQNSYLVLQLCLHTFGSTMHNGYLN